MTRTDDVVEERRPKYLKDVLPRVFEEIAQWAAKEDELDILRQAEHLFITGRCRCGSCCHFFVDSDLDELSRAKGSTKLLRPLYYDFEGIHLMLGMTQNDDGSYNLASFESAGYDYPDGYINAQLEAHGWTQPEPDDD